MKNLLYLLEALLCFNTLLQRATAQSNLTCQGLEDFIANSNNESLTNCVRNNQCSSVSCDTTGMVEMVIQSSEVILLPCDDPPAVRLILLGPSSVVLNKTLNSSADLVLPNVVNDPFTFHLNLLVAINVSMSPDELGIQANLRVRIMGINMDDTVVLNRFTVIPLDTSNCPNRYTTVMSADTTVTSADTTVTSANTIDTGMQTTTLGTSSASMVTLTLRTLLLAVMVCFYCI